MPAGGPPKQNLLFQKVAEISWRGTLEVDTLGSLFAQQLRYL
jgi:hypothetical protein